MHVNVYTGVTISKYQLYPQLSLCRDNSDYSCLFNLHYIIISITRWYRGFVFIHIINYLLWCCKIFSMFIAVAALILSLFLTYALSSFYPLFCQRSLSAQYSRFLCKQPGIRMIVSQSCKVFVMIFNFFYVFSLYSLIFMLFFGMCWHLTTINIPVIEVVDLDRTRGNNISHFVNINIVIISITSIHRYVLSLNM